MSASRPSLRRRVTWRFVALGATMSLMFAGTLAYLAEAYEEILVEELLASQAEDYDARLATTADAHLPRTRRLSGYRLGVDDVPEALRALVPGLHEDESGAHIGVFDTAHGRLIFVLDLSAIERIEAHMVWALLAVVLLGTAFAGWLGWVLSGTATAPVRRLAAAVDALDTTPRASELAARVEHDELHRLAQAIDGYQARLVAAAEAERRFFADANHELRTPVAVVRGAVELLLDEPTTDTATLRRLHRLDRGVHELADLIDALMCLVREPTSPVETLSAREWLDTCADALRADLDPQRVTIRVDAEGEWRAPRREATLVLRAIARRLLVPEVAGELTLRARDDFIDVAWRGTDPDGNAGRNTPPPRGDRGLSLTLIGRLATRLGWRVEESASQVRVHARG